LVGLSLSSDETTYQAPGTAIKYSVSITNSGDLEDTYDLTAVGTWLSQVNPISVTLESGETSDVVVTIAVPPDAQWGDEGTVVLTATSRLNTAVVAHVNLTTIVDVYQIYLPYASRPE
jgi:uncharacterized membrane protein